MPEPVISALINAGILGPVLMAVGWYTMGLQKKLHETHEKRVEDAQRVVTQLLELNDRWNASIAQATASTDELRESLMRLHSALTDLRIYGTHRSPPGGSS